MATYRIGQFRSTQTSNKGAIEDFCLNYNEGSDYIKTTILNEETIVPFEDECLNLPTNKPLSPNNSYYLRFNVLDMPTQQQFTVKLKNRQEVDGNIQETKTFKVPAGLPYDEEDKSKNRKWYTFEFIFTPNAEYDTIFFELQRMSVDFTTETGERNGRIMEINIQQYCLVRNIIDTYLSNTSFYGSDLSSLKKIGIQGPPGLLMCINGEEIRITRTGIYELYHDSILVTYLGFIPKESDFTEQKTDFFIVDFKY